MLKQVIHHVDVKPVFPTRGQQRSDMSRHPVCSYRRSEVPRIDAACIRIYQSSDVMTDTFPHLWLSANSCQEKEKGGI